MAKQGNVVESASGTKLRSRESLGF